MKQTYVGLDILRFAAAALVMMFHLSYFGWIGTSYGQILHPIGQFFTAGWIGVPIFFVLSGFVIAFSASGKTHRQFVLGRALRLYPAAWLCASLTLIAILGQPDVIQRYLSSIVLSPVGPWVDPVYWTLGVEIVFYALVWMLLLAFGSRHLFELGAGLGLVSSAFWFGRVLDFALGRHFEPVFAPFDTPLGGLTLVPHGAAFSLGIMLWSMAADGISVRKALLAALFLGANLIDAAAGARYHFLVGEAPRTDILVAPFILLLAVGLIAASTFWNGALQRHLGRWSGALRTVGLATYPIYLLHEEIGWRIMKLLDPSHAMLALAGAVAVVAACVALVLWLEPYLKAVLAGVLNFKSRTAEGAQLP